MLSFHVNRNYSQPVIEIFENVETVSSEDLFNTCIEISRNYESVFIKFHENVILTSKTIGVMVKINKAVDDLGKNLYIYGVNEKSLRLLDLMRLTTCLNVSLSHENPF